MKKDNKITENESEEIRIDEAFYERIALRLAEEIGDRSYFSGRIVLCQGSVEYCLVASLIIYHDRAEWPDGIRSFLSDIVPVWWEFHTLDEKGEERPNDFSFDRVRTLFPLAY